MPDQPAAIPWYKSNVLRGIAVALVTRGLVHFHVAGNFTSDEISSFVDDALDSIGFAAGAYAAYARTRQPNPQIVAGPKTAAAINAQPETPK